MTNGSGNNTRREAVHLMKGITVYRESCREPSAYSWNYKFPKKREFLQMTLPYYHLKKFTLEILQTIEFHQQINYKETKRENENCGQLNF